MTQMIGAMFWGKLYDRIPQSKSAYRTLTLISRDGGIENGEAEKRLCRISSRAHEERAVLVERIYILRAMIR